MSQTINFGIDLGTTNSVIAKCDQGKTDIFRNPLTQKETLPSVVAFRKNRILVGDKAREYMTRDPQNVVGAFKRKMGTSVRYPIASTGENIGPVALSAHVLKELKTFVHTGESVEAAVITIPASFDTIQSNATRNAGLEAGFSEVVLLQEPIAASLAFVNRNEDQPELQDGQWLVYDLGGGTFDVALVRIVDGEMNIIDHEGNNFLGGADFDALLIEHIIVPHLEAEGKFSDLLQEMKSASGRYNKLWFQLQTKVEEAKIMLSTHESAEVEFEVEDDTGELLDIYLTLHRHDFERLIDPYIDQTVKMILQIVERNELQPSDLQFTLMVGGSTYIPRVRERIADALGIPVNCDIDPTTAIGLGAASYAATRPRRQESVNKSTSHSRELDIRFAYQKNSTEPTEYFAAATKGDTEGLHYRIVREDKGYDSGLKSLSERIEEDLPLVPDAFNRFQFTVYDARNNTLDLGLPPIGISHGKFSVTGQPLPHDICLEVDDIEGRQTRSELIFSKNDVLPLRRTVIKEVTRTIKQGSNDQIIINVLEGPENAVPSVLQNIGHIVVEGKQLERDLLKGSDVEIILELSESRDLRISALLLMTDQEFTNVFTASERHVDPINLRREVRMLVDEAEEKILDIEANDDFETAIRAVQIKDELETLAEKLDLMRDDDVTDARFQYEDEKRRLAQQLSELTREQELDNIKLEFFEAKRECREMVAKYGNALEEASLKEILAEEREVLRSDSQFRLREAIERLHVLTAQLRWKTPEYLKWLFQAYYIHRVIYPNPAQADPIIARGIEAANKNDLHGLQLAIGELFNLLPQEKKDLYRRGTGIG